METIYEFYASVDFLLIFPFRWADNLFVGYLLGTMLLSALCVIFGELTLRIARLITGRHADAFQREATRMHNLSIRAILRKDKERGGWRFVLKGFGMPSLARLFTVLRLGMLAFLSWFMS